MLKSAALIAIAATAAFFSLYQLTESPAVWYDEGWYLQISKNIAETGVGGLQTAPGVIENAGALTTVGYPLLYPMAGWFGVFGYGIFQARLFMVLCLMAFLGITFFFAKRLGGTWVAIGSLALIATFPPLYGNGKGMLGEVPGLLFLLLFLFFFSLAVTRTVRNRPWLVLSGLSLGLCAVTKPLFLLLVPAALVGFAVAWRRGSIGRFGIGLALCSAVLPFLAWALIQFPSGTSFFQILNYYANPHDVANLWSVIATNVQGLFTDLGVLYFTAAMIVWAVAILLRIRDRVRLAPEEIIAFVFCVLILGAFLRTPGWYRYLFPAQALVLVFLPLTLLVLGKKVAGLTGRHGRRFIHATPPLLIAALSFVGIYQLAFDSWVAEAYGNTRTASWQEYFLDLRPPTSVFFYNVPEIAAFIPHRNYYQFIAPGGTHVGEEYLSRLAAGLTDKVIIEKDVYAISDKSVFRRYTLERELDRYLILMKR